MASRRKNQDEKNLKLLRELATLPLNKQCFDCRQKGPTYVNMTIGSFVCTTCSGILRGLNPPHRVKSISMTSFTPEDIDFIKTRGNELSGYCLSSVQPRVVHIRSSRSDHLQFRAVSIELISQCQYCRKVWFGQSDSRVNLGPESKDEQKIKDFMMNVYDKKKWWIDPSTVAAQTAQIEQMMISPPPGKVPLSSLLGRSHTPLYIPSTTQNASQQINSAVTTDRQTIAPTEKKTRLISRIWWRRSILRN
ncbi:Arf-GAP domain and FG repeat-containing protein 1 [Nymphon striatum]|nr:Arf-GAP domain and FG repeat-containing protein 1 [Nymphon striatum]